MTPTKRRRGARLIDRRGEDVPQHRAGEQPCGHGPGHLAKDAGPTKPPAPRSGGSTVLLG